MEKRLRESTAEFHAMQITQRPTFVIDTEIGDRAVFSGIVRLEPIAATIDSMLDDAALLRRAQSAFRRPAAEMKIAGVANCIFGSLTASIYLASVKMLPTTSLRLAINDAGTSLRSSQPRQSRVYRRIGKVDVDEMRKTETPAKWRTPVSRTRRLE